MKFFRIGLVKGTHGLDGEIKLTMNTDNIELVENLEYLMLGKNRNPLFSGKVEYIEPMNGLLLVKIENINDVDAAMKFKGYEVLVPENLLPAENSDEVYWFKIEGADVFDENGTKFGNLIDYIEGGSTDIFRIKGLDDKYYLISNNKSHVLMIDAENHKIVIRQDGLVDEDL
ncbi:ribosome maturation factor RimM [Calditerrivibrio sp.]|uniref:ribosome maturation factor RimM n=1 Tax=Calditerrivibrio sp. TaxID=2792612 RepID=UPI003D0E7EE3